jgi:FkbM family methyltransferase
MPIISYAQNFEDVMLWRALRHIENGFYVDVGANDPVIDSVTNLFYVNGWHGINVEPLRKHFKSLVESRPKDINLNVALSDSEGELEIWESEVRGWATLDKEVAEQHELNGFNGDWTKTSVRTLKNILDENLSEQQTDIHFLKIDVEGVEESVVRGNDWLKFRPWIVIIESTKPNSQQESYESWEQIILDRNYEFVYFDGLNRFYVSQEHSSLATSFLAPPNVFDEFISYREEKEKIKNIELTSSYDQLKSSYNQLELDYQELKSNKLNLEETLSSLKADYQNIKNEIDGVFGSYSWKITAPLRYFSSFFKRNKK